MRIVSLSPSFTEILQALQSDSDLVGVTHHCPHKSVPRAALIGSPKALDLETIKSLRPDLILAHDHENRPEELKRLRDKRNVLSFDIRSIQHVIDTIHTIGDTLGKRKEAEVLKNRIKEAWKKNQEELAGGEPIPVLILLWNNPFLTVNFDTYTSRLLETCGGSNIFRSDPIPEFAVEIEDMIDRNPRILLLPKSPYPFAKRHIEGFRKYRVFSKIRIELIDGTLISRFGPRTVEALKTFRDLIH